MSDFAKNLVLAIVAPLAASAGQMAVDAANHRREQAKASRERWESLIAQAKEDRVKP